VGLATAGSSTTAAGVLGTAATWVASTGNRAAGREAQTPRLVGAGERQARVWGGGVSCAALALACTSSPSQKPHTHKRPLEPGARPQGGGGGDGCARALAVYCLQCV
jgi:hypothetical protein